MHNYSTHRPPSRVLAGPLRSAFAALERGDSVEHVLRLAVGPRIGGRVLHTLRHVRIREIRDPLGVGRRYSARAPIHSQPVHSERANHVRRATWVFLSIMSWLGPNLATGHRLQRDRLNVEALAARVGVDPREIARYMAAFVSAKIIKRWQPRSRSEDGSYFGPSGHAFTRYALYGDQLPSELESHLAKFHRSWWPRARKTVHAIDAAASLSDAADAALAAVRGPADDAAMDAALAAVRGLAPS